MRQREQPKKWGSYGAQVIVDVTTSTVTNRLTATVNRTAAETAASVGRARKHAADRHTANATVVTTTAASRARSTTVRRTTPARQIAVRLSLRVLPLTAVTLREPYSHMRMVQHRDHAPNTGGTIQLARW